MAKQLITADPEILCGKPVISGTRIPVYLILELLEAGKSIKQIIDDYPELTEEEVKAAIHYAEAILKREELVFSA